MSQSIVSGFFSPSHLRNYCFAVWPHSPPRGLVHGLHEHRHLPPPTRGGRRRADRAGRDAPAPGGPGQPDGHHQDPAEERGSCGRQGQGREGNSDF